MYIRRKVFSVLNLDGEQRLFSTNSIDFCENGEVRLFSDEEEGPRPSRTRLAEINSHKGRIRSMIIGGLPGGNGGYVSKAEADAADEEGLSDKEITNRAKKKALKYGAISGAVAGAASNAMYGGARGAAMGAATGAAIGAAAGAGFGAARAHIGAARNVKERL